MSAMSTPTQSPGWYPAPDGNGQQWWNGSAWSDARRNAAGTAPTLGGLPNYQAEPPRDGQAANIPVPPPGTALRSSGVSIGNPTFWVIPLVFSIVGFTVYNLFAVFALLAGLAMFKPAGPISRVIIAISIVISIAAIVSGVISYLNGERTLMDIIF
jgi:hypothetical protein